MCVCVFLLGIWINPWLWLGSVAFLESPNYFSHHQVRNALSFSGTREPEGFQICRVAKASDDSCAHWRLERLCNTQHSWHHRENSISALSPKWSLEFTTPHYGSKSSYWEEHLEKNICKNCSLLIGGHLHFIKVFKVILYESRFYKYDCIYKYDICFINMTQVL